MRPKRVLIATDFSDSADRALSYAASLADRFGADLHLLHVLVLYGDTTGAMSESIFSEDSTYWQLEERASEQMRRSATLHKIDLARFTQAQRREIAPGPAIVDYAAEEDIDLIVMGTHGRRGLRRALLGSVAEEVVRTAGCTVVTVRGDQEGAAASFRRVVVPCDFSRDSDNALEEAKDFIADEGGELHLVHVMASPILVDGLPSAVQSLPALGDLSQGLHEALRSRVEGWNVENLTVETHVLEGSITSQIVDFAAEKNADLIVMGRHGLSGLDRFLLGSVSEKVVRFAQCPVMILQKAGPPVIPAEAEGDGVSANC